MKKLLKYRTAGVREYWIINPMTQTVTIYDFEKEESSGQYNFDQPVASNIYNNLEITIAELLK